jgi:hypothetical protein
MIAKISQRFSDLIAPENRAGGPKRCAGRRKRRAGKCKHRAR